MFSGYIGKPKVKNYAVAFFVVAILMVVVFIAGWRLAVKADDVILTNTPPICSSVECTQWDTCLTTGFQSCLSTVKYPAGCQGGVADPSPRTCRLACTDFIYGEWSTCQATSSLSAVGHQSRVIKEKIPTGCMTYPDINNLRRECPLTILTTCTTGDWYCGDWSDCLATGQRNRQCTLLKSDCLSPELVKPILTETCSPNIATSTSCLNFVCKTWSGCSGTNTMEACLDFSKSPVNCIGEAPSSLRYRNCTISQTNCTSFVCNSWSGCTGTNPIETCTGGFKKIPENCFGSPAQEAYSRTCLTTSTACKVEWACDGSWGDCQPNGWRYQSCRQITCLDTPVADPGKREACQYKQTTETITTNNCTADYWVGTDKWTDCHLGRRQKIFLKEKDCPNIDTAMPMVYEKCANTTTDTIPRIINTSNSTPEIKKPEQNKIFTKEQIQTSLPTECRSAGITDNSACELYLRQQHSTDVCLEAGAQNKIECRKVLEQQYQKPSQCVGLSEVECSRLVNQVILANYIEPSKFVETEAQVATLTNQVLVINPDANTDDKILIQTIPLNQSDQVSKTRNFDQAQNVGDALSLATNQKINLMVLNSSVPEEDRSKKISAVVMIDQDADGLPDDQELRFGTNPNKADTDNDGYSDLVEIKAGYNPLGLGKSTVVVEPIDKAIINQAVIEQPRETPAQIDDVLNIAEVKNTNSKMASSYQISGQAKPNQIITLYIYSQMPLVLTTKADANGNWTYQLDKSLNDGKHEVYVAINDDAGRISSQSAPLSFFIKEAKALTMDEFIAEEQVLIPSDGSSGKMLAFYIASGSALILSVLMIFILFRKKLYN